MYRLASRFVPLDDFAWVSVVLTLLPHLGDVWFTAFTRHCRCGATTKFVAGVASVAAATTVVKIYAQSCCGVVVADFTYITFKHQTSHRGSHKYGVASEGGQPNSPLL